MNHLKLAGIIGGALALLVLVWAVVAHFDNDADTRDALEKLEGEAGRVLTATQDAADNPDLKWEQVPGQIDALGDSINGLRVAISTQNERINEMAREAVRLRARAEELQEIADQAKAQRAAALRRLSDMELTPGTRDDCLTLLREAEEALDLVYEAGL